MTKKEVKNIWERPDVLDSFETTREKRRALKPQLTFDCFNAHARGDRVVCVNGYPLGSSNDGSMYLASVLKGTTSAKCKGCPDFNGD